MANTETTKNAARKIYDDRLEDGGCLTVFSHSTPGVPTLTTMSKIAKEIGGEICHSGFGLFYCKVGSRKIFFFDAGGSMTRVLPVRRGDSGDRNFYTMGDGRGHQLKCAECDIDYAGDPETPEDDYCEVCYRNGIIVDAFSWGVFSLEQDVTEHETTIISKAFDTELS